MLLDTGFITYVKGWNEIRETDRGLYGNISYLICFVWLMIQYITG